MPNLSFITANYVARALNYPGGTTGDWAKHDEATIAAASPEHFADVAREIAEAGFDAIDIWKAHCHYEHHGREDYVEQIKGICSAFDFAISSYAGGLNVTTAAEVDSAMKFIKQLGTRIWAGGMFTADAAQMTPIVHDICEKYDTCWAFENHPETSAAEILSKISGGKYKRVGVALDTGWCGTHGMDAVETAKALREKLLIVHLKDVTKAGAHETCALGDGIVNVQGVVRYLVESGWSGNFCIEHEPFDRDPMPEIMISCERVKQWLR